ncbi:methylthioribose-1-phosphate isomerase [Natronocella acetinitrilica]|uniref:Methylthioribose-1-phosphate isomerase n=1 Tax=Natronocella acetinitrilica TaxID=414046 RepID=A0AAE3G2V9_9GAMM|nr:S-methyl-5-thioribose-1-phosphate isomerase [Natronocella acetinitrilica]MCP1674791.1 methylthioribose-1-phosphate isomerase [Natronocella acetinitrilica]
MPDHDSIRPFRWAGDSLILLDQRRLPEEVSEICCTSAAKVAEAIAQMVVRGAPAIGIAGAYGAALAWREAGGDSGQRERLLAQLRAARPTAVNLAWALDRIAALGDVDAGRVEAEANAIAEEDLAANQRMGELGAAYIDAGSGVLTHCNTGSLATGGYGTALGVIRSAWSGGLVARVYADETRPWMQGSRLTAWELLRDGIPVTLLADSAAPLLMRDGAISWVIVGADRITANGDVANKIGTYGLAIAARHHGVRFMVVAPSSTVDMALACGDEIPVEHRDPEELLAIGGKRLAAQGADAWNPVFDVTPAELVDVLVTERGVVEKPSTATMAKLFGGQP